MKLRKSLDGFAAVRLAELREKFSRSGFMYPLDQPAELATQSFILDSPANKIPSVQRKSKHCLVFVRVHPYATHCVAKHACPVTAARIADLFRFIRLGGFKMPDWDNLDGGPWIFSRDRAVFDYDSEPYIIKLIDETLALF
jgi:hypothetical protein